MRRMRAQADMEGKSLYAVCSRGSLGPDLFLTGLAASCLPQQLRQLGNIADNPPRLRRRSPSRLVLELDVGERLAAAISHDEASRLLLN